MYPNILNITQRVSLRMQTIIISILRASKSIWKERRPIHIYLCHPLSRIDISDEFSFTHMLEFSKLAVAFAVELGGWTKSK